MAALRRVLSREALRPPIAEEARSPCGGPSVLRVMHIVSGDLWAGAEVVVWSLLREIHAAAGIRLVAVVLNDGRLRAELDRIAVPTCVCDEARSGFLELAARCRKLALRFRPHIIHAHRYKENALAVLSRALGPSPGAALVTTQHGLPEEVGGGRRAWRPRMLMALNYGLQKRWFGRVVVVSEAMRRHYTARLGFRAERVAVIHNGVALPASVGVRRPARPFVIGAASRLFPVKDLPSLVEVARRVVMQAGPAVRFVIAGDGPEREPIAALIRSRGLEASVQLAGHIDSMPDFYRAIDLFVNTSFHEGIPMGVLEAMAHGIPVVAFAVGGLPEIIADGRQGFLISGRSPERFAAACLRLMEAPDLYARMSQAARERIEAAFSLPAMARSYLALYREIALGGRGGCDRGSGGGEGARPCA